MSRKYIKKHKHRTRKVRDFYNIVNSINILDSDCREIFDNAVNFEYGEPLSEYSEKAINAIMVNDIRHNYSNYEQNLKEVDRIHRSNKDYIQYKNAVLDKISNAYPGLKNECERQKRKCNMVKLCN